MGRVGAEQRRALAQRVEFRLGGRQNLVRRCGAQTLVPFDARAIPFGVGGHVGNPAKIPALAAGVLLLPFFADQQQRVAGLEIGRDAFQINRSGAELRHVHPAHPRLERVPLHPRVNFFHGLEGLRLFAGSGNALDSRADVDRRRAGGVVERESQNRAGRDAGMKLVADEPAPVPGPSGARSPCAGTIR